MTGRDLRHLSSVQPTSPAKGSGDGEGSSSPTPRRLQPSNDNVVSLADAREAADDGHRDALAEWTCALAAKPAPRQPLDPQLAALVARDLAAARERLIDDMKMLDANRDQAGASEMHLLAGTAVNAIDEAAEVLCREIGS